MKTHYIDIHCHPSLKPYSKSFKYDPQKQNARDANRKNAIWHYSPPTFLEKLVNRIATLTKFTQTDMTALAKAKTEIVIVSLYPFEKHFLSKRIWGWKGLTDALVNLAAGVSQQRIDYVLNHSNYYQDLEDEYAYYLQLHNQVQKIEDVVYTYRVVKNAAEITQNLQQNTPNKRIINVILSIEGGHSFNTGLKMDVDTAIPHEVLQHVRQVKMWEHPPLFITLAHHFYNELCGHSPSIGIAAIKGNQTRGLTHDITPLGKEVIDLLLNKTVGKRILIDVKHLNLLSRKTYYHLLDTVYAQEALPVIASHGGVTGYRSIHTPNVTDYPDKAVWFTNIEINFYDDELIRIAKTQGIFGIQLDERRIGSKKAIAQSKIWIPNTRKLYQKKALLVWRQIAYIAEVLNAEGLFCWGIQCIGSDFDGIVDPINGLWTAEHIRDLGEELLHHARAYLKEHQASLLPFNRISEEAIVTAVLRNNAFEFIQRHF
ncbi:MAG: membrane dipeptidase [Flavobacteriaceae bacterium]